MKRISSEVITMLDIHDPIDVLTIPPMWVDESDTLRHVAEAIVAAQSGALLVHTDDAHPAVVSERDLLEAVADGFDVDTSVARDVMTRTVKVAAPGDTIVDVGLEMVDSGVRHIVVVDGDTAVGIASMRDVMRVLVDAAMTWRHAEVD